METASLTPPVAPSLSARAVLLGERLDTAGLERSDLINTVPLAFRAGQHGFAVLFRYGVAVLVGLSPVEEDELLRGLASRVSNPTDRIEEESAALVIAPEKDEQIAPGGPILLSDLSPARLVVLADVLAKNVALSRHERQVSRVFEVIDPFAAELATKGRPPGNRRSMLRLIGQALLVHHRMSGRVEVNEKPDILWDRPDLERLYARLADEYELSERAAALTRKLEVIGDTAQALTDLIDTERSVRLEAAIVLLIVVEIVITLYDLFLRAPK
jgi:uncharacterized Rmd1/YagE family protein